MQDGKTLTTDGPFVETKEAIGDLIFEADDLDAAIEWVGPPEWLETHLYKGHDGVREIAAQWTENFDEYRVDPVEFLDAGDRVIVLALQRGRIKNSSVPIEDQISYVWTLRDGKGVHVQVYFTWDEALGRSPGPRETCRRGRIGVEVSAPAAGYWAAIERAC